MQRPSRSKSKINPEFDLNELADLIHTPAVGSGVSSHLLERSPGNLSTVVVHEETTVVISDETAVVKNDLTTVVDYNSTTVVTLSGLWVNEAGGYVPPRKVRRIDSALDALSSTEQSVYELLSRLKTGSREVAQAGYDFIMKQTGLSKKTVQRVIDKLIDKDFITIETPADIYRRTATVYRVRRQEAILASHEGKQRRHVAKVGPGKVYVRPFANTRPL